MVLGLMMINPCMSANAQPLVSTKISKGYNPYYSALDTIAQTGHDTMYAAISGTKNSVGFGFNVTPVTGSTDTFLVKIYANKLGTNVGPWYLVTTLTGSYTNTLLDYNFTGNPYTNYMCVLSSVNVAACTASWRTYCLIR
jgi:hypothetical protein